MSFRVGAIAAYLEILRPHSGHVGDSEDEAYCIEDIGLSRAVEASNGIEALIPGENGLAHPMAFHRIWRDIYHPVMTVRTAYDLKPCIDASITAPG